MGDVAQAWGLPRDEGAAWVEGGLGEPGPGGGGSSPEMGSLGCIGDGGPYVRQGPLTQVGSFRGTVGPGETLGLHGWNVKCPEGNSCAWVKSEGSRGRTGECPREPLGIPGATTEGSLYNPGHPGENGVLRLDPRPWAGSGREGPGL